MTIPSSVRSRRFAKKQPTEVLHSLIGFRIRQSWFALPIETVQKVIPLESVYNDPRNAEIRLIRYQNQEIVIIDGEKRIFGSSSPTETIAKPQFLAIIQGKEDRIIGLPIDSPPSLRRVRRSAFVPLAKTDLAENNIADLSATLIQIPDHPPLFLLDVRMLVLP